MKFRHHSPVCSAIVTGAAVMALGACSTLTLGEQRNSEADTLKGNEQSDYDILSCDEMTVIETNARQQLKRLGPTAENRVEREYLLNAQIREISMNQQEKGCPPSRSSMLAAAEEQPIAPRPATEAPEAAPAPPAGPPETISGTFLQIGSFANADNATAAAEHFASQGMRSEIRVTGTGAAMRHRVLVGPLNPKTTGARAINASYEIGVRDAFFIKG